VAAWRRICCPVDFTAPSRLALRVAAELAQASKAHLTLLLVTGRRVGPANVFAPPSALGPGRRRREAFAAWLEEAEALAPGRVDSAVLSGVADEQVLGFAEECGFDLIVVGTAGPRRVFRRASPLAEALLRRAAIPVLFVPPTSPGPATATA